MKVHDLSTSYPPQTKGFLIFIKIFEQKLNCTLISNVLPKKISYNPDKKLCAKIFYKTDHFFEKGMCQTPKTIIYAPSRSQFPQMYIYDCTKTKYILQLKKSMTRHVVLEQWVRNKKPRRSLGFLKQNSIKIHRRGVHYTLGVLSGFYDN